MDQITSAPIRYGLIRLIRSSSDLRTALKGGIHNSLARRKVAYPFVVIQKVSDPITRDPGGEGNAGHIEIDSLWDVIACALSQVEADNLDLLLANWLSGPGAEDRLQPFIVGQNLRRIDRVGTPGTGPERDAVGRWVVRQGGTYRVVTDTALAIP